MLLDRGTFKTATAWRLAFLSWLILGQARPAAFAQTGTSSLSAMEEENRIKRESEEKIQKSILDPILGQGKAVVFVEVEMELKATRQESNRSGMGLAERYKEKLGQDRTAGAQTTFLLPGVPKPRTISQGDDKSPERPETVRAQQSQQVKGVVEEQLATIREFKRLLATVIHDESVLQTDISKKLVRDRIVDAMGQYKLTPEQVVFRPTAFNPIQKAVPNWREDIQRPEVYLPLLFAGLLSLLLLWLFFPLTRFFKQYVAALREKPGAEVNIENKEEEGDGGGKGDDGKSMLEEKGELDINFQNKPPEVPEEEDAMKKFEPFTYINETNLKRLVYMFLLRKEEPWVVAVVCSYLRPDYAKQVITALPIELQAKVAIEALTVRQVTRAQVMAIDEDVKENVDFVVGGMERLLTMLDEADTATRNNILNYLKNDKPMLYERVRKFVLTFEDVANFPDREMQALVRELKPEDMARALQNAPPEVVNKFFSNMSTGAASVLKEAMEYTKALTQAQIDEDRAKIMDLVKVLEKKGQITVREKPQEGMDLEGLAEEMSAQQSRAKRFEAAYGKEAAPAAAPAPAQAQGAQAYFATAVSYHDAGQLEESLPYFEYALTQDPNLWQAHQYMGGALYQLGRVPEALAHFEKLLAINPDPQLKTWVEGLKAQVGA